MQIIVCMLCHIKFLIHAPGFCFVVITTSEFLSYGSITPHHNRFKAFFQEQKSQISTYIYVYLFINIVRL